MWILQSITECICIGYECGRCKLAAADEAIRSLAVRVGIPQHRSSEVKRETDLERLSEAAWDGCLYSGKSLTTVSKEIIYERYMKLHDNNESNKIFLKQAHRHR